MNNKISIKNISTATVVIVTDNFRRELTPGRTIPISRTVYEDLSFDTGFNNLLAGHFIQILGIEEEEAISDNLGTFFDAEAIGKMYDNKDYVNFAKFIASARPAEKDTAVKLAIEKGINDNGFSALIKKYCDVDVISAFNIKHQLEE